MPKNINITIPDEFALNIGGQDVTFRADEIAHDTFVTCFWHGMRRKGNDTHTGKRAQAKASGVDWLDSDDDKLRAEIAERFRRGDWGVRDAAPVDPVGKLAAEMARDELLIIFAKAAGVYNGATIPRAKRVFEALSGDAQAKMAKYGEVDGKSWKWDSDAIAARVESGGFRKRAETELKRRESVAADVDLSDL